MLFDIKQLIQNNIDELENVMQEDRYNDIINNLISEIHYDIITNGFSFDIFKMSKRVCNLLENYNEQQGERASSYWG